METVMGNARKLLSSTLIALPLLAILAADAQARCTRWSVDGIFRFKQSNGFTVRCSMEQGGRSRAFEGLCNTGNTGGDANGSIGRQGKFNMLVRWGNGGSVGEYTGIVNGQGQIEDGRTYDQKSPGNWAKWWNTTDLKCTLRGR
jgi:hypothetical protein